MIPIWRPITSGTYRVRKGDVLTLFGEDPSDVAAGLGNYGYVVGQAAGNMVRDIVSDYDEEDEPTIWTKFGDDSARMRFAMHKIFSAPLPLP